MMSSSTVRAFAVICLIAYCNAESYITAYVKQHLYTTKCVSVPRIPSVCDVQWKVRESDAEMYDEMIQSINLTISSKEFLRGLNGGDAMHCLKMYENMMCRNAFPVCDMKRMVVDHGNGKARCEFARDACTTISIEGCEYSENGVKPIISNQDKCEDIAANTSILCPNNLKVPKINNVFVKQVVDDLTTIAETFSKEMIRTQKISESCELKYREVLCRLIDACSPDGLNYLRYINKKECEEMISCVKSAGFSTKITSVCERIPSTEFAEKVTVRNPYIEVEQPLPTTTRTHTTAKKTDSNTTSLNTSTTNGPITSTTKDRTTSARNDSTTTEKPDQVTNMVVPTQKEKGTDPATTIEQTTEILEEPSEENNEGSTETTVRKSQKGSANTNYHNLFMLIVALTLSLGLAMLP